MTDVNNNAAITLEPLGAGPTYANVNVWLPQLFLETARAGSQMIENRRFEGCLIEGPAVILPVEGCSFDGCDMGVSNGDPRNLMLSPLGPRQVVGVVPFKNCQFINCRFLGVGFTGASGFLDNMVQALGDGAAA